VDIRGILLIIFRKYETPATPHRAFGPTNVTSGTGTITVRLPIVGVVGYCMPSDYTNFNR
jgi:hypothetical protein